MFVDINYNYNFSQEGNGFRNSVFFYGEKCDRSNYCRKKVKYH